ncbi:MAG: hypothetical protein INQ03_18845 [Candidatus Heimdallarchaeota archaeon]|nr:hypothetical protein [Candidatus Heimdallarchaeota archaeon]
MKTSFEEWSSAIRFSPEYQDSEAIYFYEDRYGLRPLKMEDILEHRKSMLHILRSGEFGVEEVEIPTCKVWVIMIDGIIVMDRRMNYQGYKNFTLGKFESV